MERLVTEAGADWQREIEAGERFAFGENWTAFLRLLNDDRIQGAEQSLRDMLDVERLDGKRFLDAGSGSGLFSLAARRLGAEVESFDYDPQSVACTDELKRRFFPGDAYWRIQQGSVLDTGFLSELGTFDIVYSWGVLHHTGAMWEALEDVARLVTPEGQLFIAIYNDQGRASDRWRRVKRAYVATPAALKWAILLPAFARLWGPTLIKDLLRGRPFRSWTNYSEQSSVRGMDPWRDVIDWVGGYPFEVAKPEQILDFFHVRCFETQRMTCAGGIGCNEFVFVNNQTSSDRSPSA